MNPPNGNTASKWEPPNAALSVATCALAILAMLWMRLFVFPDKVIPMGTGLPLLLCIWNRDLRLLYAMAGFTLVTSVIKFTYLVPTDADYSKIIIISQTFDVAILTGAIHGLIKARRKLDERNQSLHRLNSRLEIINDELMASNEELAAREEEIMRQNEELQSQSEELEQQAEDLRQQTEETEQKNQELQELNAELVRRDNGLRTLLDSARWLRSDMDECFVMNGICQAAVQVLGNVQAAAITVNENGLLGVKGSSGFGLQGPHTADVSFASSFTDCLLASGRTACIEDLNIRQDLKLPPPVTGAPFRSVLGAPVWTSGTAIGALEVYAVNPRNWSQQEFHIVEWLASQAAVALQGISAQRELERNRHDAEEASRQKTRFLAAVSHDVRTPAHAISLLADVIHKCAEHPDNAHRIPSLAKDLWSNAKAMVDLVTSVLDITRLDSGGIDLDIREFALCEAIRSALRQASAHAENKGLTLTCDLPDAPIWIASDITKLQRILSNLISNAVKFTEAGEVKVELVSSGDGGATIHVRDTGIGIPSDQLERIFDEFFQLRNPERDREKGAGLGLAICHRIAKTLGFEIKVQSHLGLGSTFSIGIPASKIITGPHPPDLPPHHAETIAETNRNNPLDNLEILLVEDHGVAREATAGLLTSEGAKVCLAANGREAIKSLMSGKHELLLLDLNLPDFDGTEILKTLQHHRPRHLRWIIVLSGDVRPERAHEVKRLGASWVMAKPVSIHAIREVLQLATSGNGQSPS